MRVRVLRHRQPSARASPELKGSLALAEMAFVAEARREGQERLFGCPARTSEVMAYAPGKPCSLQGGGQRPCRSRNREIPKAIGIELVGRKYVLQPPESVLL